MRLSITLLVSLLTADSYKILVYNSQYGYSHSNFMGRIGYADVLVDAGHNVTSFIPVIDPNSVDYPTKSSKIYVPHFQGAATAEFMNQFSGGKMDLFEVNNFNPLGSIFLGYMFSSMFGNQCRAVLEERELLEKLRNEHYDVMITENADMCGTALTELIKPKAFILTSSSFVFAQQYEEFGVLRALSYNPEPYLSGMNVHSMWDRLVNVYSHLLVRYTFGTIRSTIDALFKEKFGPSFPSLLEISANSAYVFVNSEPLIDFASPTISKARKRLVINIGGIGVKEPKKLGEDGEKILSKREKTVLLSFGSAAQSAYLSTPIKLSIIEIPNLELTKWMPQTDLLGHSNLSVFITHGGMGSTQETAASGIPGIFVPLFGDQPRNADMMEHSGIGKVLNKHEVADPAKFTAIVREVLENESYRKNAKRVAEMLRKKPFSVRELIVKYTEFAAEFGPSKALRPQSHDMCWVEYHNVDVLFSGVFATLLVIAISLKFARILINRLLTSTKSKNE